MSNNTIQPIWTPSQARIEQSNMADFMRFVNHEQSRSFDDYSTLYQWSVDDPSAFWGAMWKYAGVVHSVSYDCVLEGSDIREARWFQGARLNFAENLLRHESDHPALVSVSESGERQSLSFVELRAEVSKLAESLKEMGVLAGDRVAALISNRMEAVIGMLASASIGAIWSSCSPDFGFEGVLDRFGQIAPKVLITINGYQYNGKTIDLTDTVQEVTKAIQSLERVVLVEAVPNFPIESNAKWVAWDDFLADEAKPLTFAQLPFDHPLYIMYSSGTTGKPKCIVHGAGGTLIQHLKEHMLHTDLKSDDVITYYTTCGWMMWNWLASALAVGATVVIYDGSPSHPDLGDMFRMIEEEKINVFGTSPKFLSVCESGGLLPRETYDLSSLRCVLSTGSPLSDENFEYVYRDVKKDVQLASISGGTDILSCFLTGNPILPVYKGELQCRGLGMKVETYNDRGEPVLDEVGELVCTAPFPSRPIGFWHDDDGERYRKAYFDHYPGIWRHGDFIKINTHGGCTVYGRSDATLNAGGIRIGTAEIYGPVEALDEVVDAIVIGKKKKNDTKVVLFVVLKDGTVLDDELKTKIKSELRARRSPRHVPAKIYQVSAIPRTISGKKVELAVTKVVHGEEVTNKDALANPEVLEEFRLS